MGRPGVLRWALLSTIAAAVLAACGGDQARRILAELAEALGIEQPQEQ